MLVCVVPSTVHLKPSGSVRTWNLVGTLDEEGGRMVTYMFQSNRFPLASSGTEHLGGRQPRYTKRL